MVSPYNGIGNLICKRPWMNDRSAPILVSSDIAITWQKALLLNEKERGK